LGGALSVGAGFIPARKGQNGRTNRSTQVILNRLEFIFVHFVAKEFYWDIFPIFK
jgi:hypothetical protein